MIKNIHNLLSSFLKNFEYIENIKQEKTIEAIHKYAHKRQEKICLMEFLKEKNIKIACYTNSIRKTAELMLKKTGILDYFDLLITNEDVEKAKPDPQGYFLCLTKTNIFAKNTIIIEDSPNGLEAAKQTNCIIVQVKDPTEVNIDLLKDIIK